MSIATTVAVMTLCVLAYGITLRNLTAEVDRTLVREASAYSAAVRSAPASEALVGATRAYLTGRAGGQANLSPILILALEAGRTISNSEIRLDTAPANAHCATRSRHRSSATWSSTASHYRTLAVPVLATDGKRLGTFQVALTDGNAQAVAAGVAGALGAAGVVVVFLGSILSIWAARGALAPLTHMAADASAISLASPGKRMAYDGPPDELGMLAHALNAMLERLEHAYAEQRRFVADASHELRTPVAIVRGNVELLRSGKLGGDDALEGLEMIDSESKRMSRLLDELLSLARLESSVHTFQPLEVRTILEEGAGRVRMLGDRTVTIEGPCRPVDRGRSRPAGSGAPQRSQERVRAYRGRRHDRAVVQRRRHPRAAHRHRRRPRAFPKTSSRASSTASTARRVRVRATRAARVSASPSRSVSSTCTAVRCPPRTSRVPARASRSRSRESPPPAEPLAIP